MCRIQNGICPECGNALPPSGKGAHLHRKNAKDGYVEENVTLVHDYCHVEQQKKQKYA